MVDAIKGLCGVWIGKDIEIIRTGLYEIQYRRNSKNQSIEAIWNSIEYTGSKLCKKTIGICHHDVNDNRILYAIKNMNHSGSECTFSNDVELLNQLTSHPLDVMISNTEITFSTRDYKEIIGSDVLTICENGEAVYTLTKDEEMVINDGTLEKCVLSESTIEDCLQRWQMGTYLSSGNSITINTKKHMYIFQISDAYIYCRAARYDTCSKGVIFVQNFRISQNQKGFKQAYMALDNTIAKQKLEIIEEHFDSGQCYIKPIEGNLIDFYWSVKSFSDDQIILNGCGGIDYYWSRSANNQVEYFV